MVHLLLGHALVDAARRALRLVLRMVPSARPPQARGGPLGAAAGAGRAAAVVSYAQRLIAPPSRARICAGFSEPPGAAMFRCYSVPHWRPMGSGFPPPGGGTDGRRMPEASPPPVTRISVIAGGWLFLHQAPGQSCVALSQFEQRFRSVLVGHQQRGSSVVLGPQRQGAEDRAPG